MVTVTLKWAKNEKTRFLESVPRGMFSLILKKKLKMRRNFKKQFFFYQVKNSFAHFRGLNKNSKFQLISNFLFCDVLVFEVKERYVALPILQIFGIELINKYLIGSNVFNFKNLLVIQTGFPDHGEIICRRLIKTSFGLSNGLSVYTVLSRSSFNSVQ